MMIAMKTVVGEIDFNLRLLATGWRNTLEYFRTEMSDASGYAHFLDSKPNLA